MNDTVHQPDGDGTPLTGRDLDALEPTVQFDNSFRTWLHILAGPTIWVTHFFVVYLVAEHACRSVVYQSFDSLTEPQLELFILVVTAFAVGLCVAAAVWSRRSAQRDPDDFPARIGVWLSLGSAASVLAVGLPVLWIGPC